MKIDQAFESRFIRPDDLKGHDWTLTISHFRIETLPSKFGGEHVRGILSFQGAKKALPLNRTNAEACRAMWGDETDDWVGKRLTIYPADFEGKLAIRVRGSPDLKEPLELEVRLPKRRPYMMRLLVTAVPAPALRAAHG